MTTSMVSRPPHRFLSRIAASLTAIAAVSAIFAFKAIDIAAEARVENASAAVAALP